MAIGERIHFFRILRGMTQKYLGTIVGFPERSADMKQEQENRKRNLLLHWHMHLMFPLMPSMYPILTAISD